MSQITIIGNEYLIYSVEQLYEKKQQVAIIIIRYIFLRLWINVASHVTHFNARCSYLSTVLETRHAK